jgi:DNA-binding LacI/PurR family transcriptional regulator
MIGLMLEDVANPYSASIYRAVEDVARGRGVGLLAGSLDGTRPGNANWPPVWSRGGSTG